MKGLTMDKVNVTFYFVSGEKVTIDMTLDSYIDYLKNIKANWSKTVSIGEKYSINFAFVTHCIKNS